MMYESSERDASQASAAELTQMSLSVTMTSHVVTMTSALYSHARIFYDALKRLYWPSASITGL